MIVEEQYSEDLVRHYSDKGMMMLQVETGVKYSDAIDVMPCRYTYVETDEPIGRGVTEETVDFLVASMQSIQSDMTDIGDGVADLSEVVSEQADELAGQGDAIADLSEIVSGLVPLSEE